MSETVERTELLPGSALALGSLLDVPVPDLDNGAGLPLLWHWIYVLDRPAQADLGPDDHPLRGTIPAPPGPGRRRMWAGGRVRTGGLLRCGESATRRSMVESVQEKQGRSGLLTFVVVRHLIVQRGTLVVDEQQDIVYRDTASPAGQASPITAGPVISPGDGERAIGVSPTLLFRFSALTYNSHHDRDYARDVEGYHGLLTHGPLRALAMADAARAAGYRRGPDAGDLLFDYRLTSPLFDYQGMVVNAVRDQDAIVTAVRDRHGRRTTTGRLSHDE